MFMLTLLVRIVTSIGGFLLTLALRPAPGWVLLRLVPTLLVALLTVTPWVDRLLQRWALALLLGLDVLIVSLQMIPLYFLRRALGDVLDERLLEATRIEPFLFLLIPLVLLAWAYGRQGALWGGTLAALLNLGIAALALSANVLPNVSLLRELVRVAMVYAVPFIVSTLAQREREQASQLAAAHRRLQRHATTVEQLAVSRERNRLARDLHDTLAHSLAALTVQLEALRTLQIHDPSAAQGAAADALDLARHGLDESRGAIQALRSDAVETIGLVGALRSELESLETRTGVSIQFNASGREDDLTDEEAQAFFRIAREALLNIERHASAQHVRFRMAFGTDRIDLSIRDDGMGFDPMSVSADHYGLMGMRERAEIIGAVLSIDSRPKGGTEVWCTLIRR